MTFAADLKRFTVTVAHRSTEVLVGVATEAHRSITEGSALTGAPGQPVDTGFLRASWQLDFTPDMRSATIGTNVAYAPVIEYGMRERFDPAGVRNDRKTPEGRSRRAIKSTVGGQGSVRLTVANADAIQREVVERVTR